MAFGTPVAAAVSYSASGGTSVAPAYPASIVSTDQLVLIVGQKPSTANGGTVTTPSGWTLRDSLTGAGGYGTTLGGDTGNTNLRIYTKDTVAGTESGTLTVTVGTNNVCWACIVRMPTTGGGTFSYGSTDGSETTGGNLSSDLAADPGLAVNDIAIWAMCIPTDVATFSAHAISAAGATFATATELREAASSNGNDVGGFIAYTTVSAGTATAAPTITATAGGTTTNVRGPIVLLRIRQTLPAITGSLSVSETGSDTAAGIGKVITKGTLAVSETGSDTASASGKVITDGALAVTESGPDTLAAGGKVITDGTLAVTETGADTASALGSVLVDGALEAAESGSDASTAAGAVLVQGSLASTETGSDGSTGEGDVFVVGALAATESGQDAPAGVGAVLIQGSLAASEAGADTAAATGTVRIQGSLAATETGADTFAATAGTSSSGTMAATEASADTLAAAGKVIVEGSLTAAETGSDALAGLGSVPVAGSAAGTESGDDAIVSDGRVLVLGAMDTGEPAGDTFAASSSQIRVGDMAAGESGQDGFAARGEVVDYLPPIGTPQGVGGDPLSRRIARDTSQSKTFIPADVLLERALAEDEIMLAVLMRAVTTGALDQWRRPN